MRHKIVGIRGDIETLGYGWKVWKRWAEKASAFSLGLLNHWQFGWRIGIIGSRLSSRAFIHTNDCNF